jgi:hypothetical protein
MRLAPSIRLRLLSILEDEASFARRGFRSANAEVQGRLESIGRTFLAGYQAALGISEPFELATHLNSVPLESRGFAYEGAAMAMALQDAIFPWRRTQLGDFLAGPAQPHLYMAHVGPGWALARLPFGWTRIWRQLDPLLRWLAIDGYGFHEGYFGRAQKPRSRRRIARFGEPAIAIYDQGFGRSLWFVHGADAAAITAAVRAAAAARHADLWSGIGLACAYADGADNATIMRLATAAGPHRLHLAQGAAFAAEARRRAGNPAPHTERAGQLIAGVPAERAAELTEIARRGLAADGRVETYQAWRGAIRNLLEAEMRRVAA